jgi:fatty acid desaturase
MANRMKPATLSSDGVSERRDTGSVSALKKARVADDMAMIRTAAELTRDLNAPDSRIYWLDFLASAAIGYVGLFMAIATSSVLPAMTAAIVAILALYRAGSFIHELTHIKRSSVPGFHRGWNAIIGIPLLVPSFMYEGVHNLHHARTRYGTAEDPEYLPLALMKPWTVPLFVLVSALGPVALFFRYALLTPLSLLFRPLRTLVVERYSGLVINPGFRRRHPEGEARSQWLWLEAAACLWAIGLLTAVVAGIVPLRSFLIFLGVASGVVVLNQIRTLVAHLWENEGEVMSVTAQFLDSVNVPPPALLPALWAPVGLRYHALHHLLPGVPYHALGEAHRRLSAAMAPESTYYRANYAGLPGLIVRLVSNTAKSS